MSVTFSFSSRVLIYQKFAVQTLPRILRLMCFLGSEQFFFFTVAHNCHGKRINFTAKRKTSLRKKNLTAKRKNLTAKRKTSRQKGKDSRQKEKPRGKKKKTHGNYLALTPKNQRIKMSFRHRRIFAVRFFFLPSVFFFLP